MSVSINKALEAPEEVGRKGRKRVMRNFSMQKREKDLVNVIEEEAVKSRKRR